MTQEMGIMWRCWLSLGSKYIVVEIISVEDIVLLRFAHSLEGQLRATGDEEKRGVCGCEKISSGIFTPTYVVRNSCQKQNETHANDNQEGQQSKKLSADDID
eukprot:13833981-Ditylum_brightwellii.AAC.1